MKKVREYFISLILSYEVRKNIALICCTANQAGRWLTPMPLLLQGRGVSVSEGTMKCHVPKRGYTGILKYFYAAGTSRRFMENLVESDIHYQNLAHIKNKLSCVPMSTHKITCRFCCRLILPCIVLLSC